MALATKHRHTAGGSGGVAGAPAAGPAGKAVEVGATTEGYLRETAWEDGAERETATVLIFAEEGRWKLMLNDRAEGCVAFVSGDTLKDAFAALEKGLVAGTLDWRASRARKPGKGK